MYRLVSLSFVLSGALALLLVCSGCSASTTAPSSPTVMPTATVAPAATVRPTPDATQIMAQLGRAASLQGAAEQCAAAIGAPAPVARVRVEPPADDGCAPCNKLPLGYVDRGVAVGDVALPLAAGSWVWLTVEDLLCLYLYDGQEFRPSSATHW